MSKYDIVPFAVGTAVGSILGWVAHAVYSKIQSERNVVTAKDPDMDPVRVVEDGESAENEGTRIARSAYEKPSLEKMRQDIEDSEEAAYIAEENDYVTPPEAVYLRCHVTPPVAHEDIKNDKDGAEIISLNEFLEGTYDKEGIEYNPNDDIMTDETGGMWEHWERFIPREFMEHFGDRSDDPEVVYVRCHDLEIDYEVVRRFVPI